MKQAIFSGMSTPEDTLTLHASFMATNQRYHVHNHQTCEMLVCRNVPITTMTPDGLCDSNETPPIELVKGARFTVLAFEQGVIVTAATYEFDGQAIFERSLIGEQIQVKSELVIFPPQAVISEPSELATVGEKTPTPEASA